MRSFAPFVLVLSILATSSAPAQTAVAARKRPSPAAKSPAAKAAATTTPEGKAQPARSLAGEAQWIWSKAQAAKPVPGSACYFRKAFDLASPENGRVAIACDDRYELFVNGRKVGAGDEWKLLNEYDISAYLVAGRNAIAVKAENVRGESAGLVARVTVNSMGNTAVSHSTDASWRTSVKDEPNWQKTLFNDARWTPAHTFGELGAAAPWGTAVQGANGSRGSRFRLPKQFRVERVAHPEDTGSLAAMAFNEWGEIIVARENGPLMVIRDQNQDGAPETVTLLSEQVKKVQGILPLNGHLFVVGEGADGSGLYRLSDKDQDGTPETVATIFKITGVMNEHGAHTPALGPDGLIYVLIGNHAQVETASLPTSPLRHYYEGDLVQPRYEDAGGHGVGVKAPGGVVVRTDVEGSFVELYVSGLRNPYDLAFDRGGELFTFDSDMEWDVGLPWYRPTRINHLVAGAEFGWRAGWAKWPEYYIDSLPATMDVGRGSPTGIEFYNHDRFPKRYKNAMFACDWSQGRILAFMFQPAGGTYNCGGEVFVQGQPLNATDLAVGPDGWLYFCTGGRDTEGGVYRVVYTAANPEPEAELGVMQAIRQPQLYSAWSRERLATIKEEVAADWAQELTALVNDPTASADDRTRALDLMQLLGPSPTTELLAQLSADSSVEVRSKAVDLMGLHADAATNARLVALLDDPDGAVRRKACESLIRAGHQPPVDKLLTLLIDPDRFVAWGARRALEAVPADQWRPQVLTTKEPRLFLHGSTALLTVGADRQTVDVILDRSRQLLGEFLTDDDFLDLLRVTQLALISGNVSGDEVPELRTQLAEEYPSLEPRINRELVRLLVHLQDETVTERFLEELRGKGAMPERLHLAAHCRFLQTNWTLEQKLELLEFYENARATPGGHSYNLYLNNFTRDYVGLMSDSERQAVLEKALVIPSAALWAIAAQPAEADRDRVTRTIELDRKLKSLDSEAARQLEIGIVAVLAASGDPLGMAYLREIFETEPARRQMIAMGLAQDPGGKNWPILLRALPVLDGASASEVLGNLLKAAETPDKPEPFRQVILCGLKLKAEGGSQAVALLEKWTGETQSQPDDAWDVALAAWQKWFTTKYPDQPDPVLPTESTASRWSEQEVLTFVTGPAAAKGDVRIGATVFEKALCVKCHRFGTIGEGIGPDLSTVSRRFQEREIIESVLYPSHVISDQYASKTIQTTRGQIVTGIVAPAGDGAVVVLEASGQKKLIPKAEIDDISPSKKSAMPDGLFNNLTLEEIAHLFAYLKTPPAQNEGGRTAERKSGATK